ncbi:uncharacterized protein C8Q71DRAFT_374417 [Rhodofomes roseus]|uniref:Uncharacterized protein n=1 Tax=Rhodofomes roseus TaxID=34475 RepID=A0ABQ8K1G9_9APHY|nr:uncharacterized protein C8Q71DRAFT_374417 [Rhodofomes roseus]KAH9830301.1 hypothetical protein C8Q71DRAFT_374417 [Rhodofomes roseus]
MHAVFDYILRVTGVFGEAADKELALRGLFADMTDLDAPDVETEEEVDEEDAEMARLEAASKARWTNLPEGQAPPPKRTNGCTKKEGAEIIQETLHLAEQFNGEKAKRKDMARHVELQEKMLATVEEWSRELEAKRLVYEQCVMMLLKEADGSPYDSFLNPQAVQRIVDFAYRLKAQNEGERDGQLEEGKEQVDEAAENDEAENEAENDEPEAPAEQKPTSSDIFGSSPSGGRPFKLLPAFVYRPPNPNARRRLSSSPLPPSSPPLSYVGARTPPPAPVTPPRRARNATPVARQPEADDGFNEPSPVLSGARPLKAFHPSSALDQDEQYAAQVQAELYAEARKAEENAEAGPSRRAASDQPGQARVYPPLYPMNSWPSQVAPPMADVGRSISEVMFKKRRRDEVEEDDEDADNVEESDYDSDARR